MLEITQNTSLIVILIGSNIFFSIWYDQAIFGSVKYKIWYIFFKSASECCQLKIRSSPGPNKSGQGIGDHYSTVNNFEYICFIRLINSAKLNSDACMYDLFPYCKSQSEYLNQSVLVLHICQKSEIASTPSSSINIIMSNNRDYKDGSLKTCIVVQI